MATEISERNFELVGDGLAKVAESAQFLGVCRSHVYKLMDQGDLPYVKIGTCRRVPWQALRELAASNLIG